jgi:Ca2+-binding RTX toxin-like protein
MKRIMLAMALMVAALVGAAGVAWAATVNCQVGVDCVGTDGPDRLVGTDEPDRMFGRQGSDRLLGYRGGDAMYGDEVTVFPPVDTSLEGDDELLANDGEDTLYGFGGDDLLRGGGRADFISAEEDANFRLNPGEDTVRGGGGRDHIFAQDGFFDTIDCGANVDTVRFDVTLDEITNCEIQNPTSAAATAKAQKLESLSRR